MPNQKKFFADRGEATQWLHRAGFWQLGKHDYVKNFPNGAQHRARIQSVNRKKEEFLFVNFQW